MAIDAPVRRGSARAGADRPPPPGRAATLTAIAAGLFITVYFAVSIRALDAFALHADLGIQYALTQETARGAIPLIDFEHGWNTLSWYYSAFLYWIAGGNATAWLFLWGRFGFIMAGIAMLVIAWRARLPAAWIAGLTFAWIVITHVPHNKYAVPTIWAAILLPTRGASLGVQRALRVGAAATVFWAHVELAILLAVGTAMYDLLGARDGALRERFVTALHAPAGVVVGLASQMAVYAALGLGPRSFISQAVLDWTETGFGPLFDFPLATPNTIRMLLFPLSLLVPFVSLIWRRLSDPTRFLALCHLALSLIAIRRPGDGHVAAAATLMVLVGVLGARDLVVARTDLAAVRERLGSMGVAVLGAVGGVVWVLVALAVGFRIPSLVAIVALTLVCLAAILLERRSDVPAASLGALGMVLIIALGSVVNQVAVEVRADDAQTETALIAEAVRADVDACVGSGREAWIVPSPLTLYDALEVTNPTPFYAFWYNFEAQTDRVIRMMDDGEVPVVIQVGSWPDSMERMVTGIEERYEVCAQPTVEATGRVVTVWRHPDV